MGDAPPKWNSDPIDTWLPHGYDVYAIAAQVYNWHTSVILINFCVGMLLFAAAWI